MLLVYSQEKVICYTTCYITFALLYNIGLGAMSHNYQLKPKP